jgi:colanic acid biosynthesis glycosyl transferase WcaI
MMHPRADQKPAAVDQNTARLRLLFFNRSYHPDVEATGQLLTELCTDLATRHAVHVVAGQPNFVAVTGGGLGLLQEDHHEGVTVTRVRNLRFSKKSLLGRALGLLTYLVLAFWVGLRARRPDVIVVETDPPLLGLLGAILARWHRCAFVYYLQDLYPEVGLALGRLRPGLLTRLLHWATQVGLRRAEAIIVLGEDMRAKVLRRGISADKIAVVPNWADTDLIYPLSPLSSRDGNLIVMYSGNLGLSQNLEQLLETARDLRHLPVQFVIAGEGAAKDQLIAQAHAWKLKNVRFMPYAAKAKLRESLTTADVHFIPLRRGLAGAIVPSKLYGILAAGVPFIAAVDPESDVARVARASGAGLVISPDSTAELATSLNWCLQNRPMLGAMGQRGRWMSERKFSRSVCVDQIDSVIVKVAGATLRDAATGLPRAANTPAAVFAA